MTARRTLSCLILLSTLLVSSAYAWEIGVKVAPKPDPAGHYSGGGRVGGDTIADATVIPSLPYADTGNTCGYANDSDEVCPYAGSTSPDVVYSYTPVSGGENIDIDLCASSYDTKVYVWQDGSANLVACNDDASCGYSGYQSKVLYVAVDAGHTYFIVVDGYGALCGDYSLAITPRTNCPCPAGTPPEGEGQCFAPEADNYNGGCEGGSGWLPISDQGDGCGAICGQTCVRVADGGGLFVDEDWYAVRAAGNELQVSCTAEIPMLLILISDVGDCGNIGPHQYATGSGCTPATLTLPSAVPGEDYWIRISPIPSVVSDGSYHLRVCGIQPAIGPVGACCLGDVCRILTLQTCQDQGGTYFGPPGCAPGMCPATTVACCLTTGECAILTAALCELQGGVPQGPGVTCEPNPCGATPVEEMNWGRLKYLMR